MSETPANEPVHFLDRILKSLPGYSEGAEYFRREGVNGTQGHDPSPNWAENGGAHGQSSAPGAFPLRAARKLAL
jgi:hypothetical protein